MRVILSLLFFFLCVIASSAISIASQDAAGFVNEGPEFRQIAIALSVSKVRGCGEMLWKKSPHGDNEYYVYCSRDGENWREYTVWPLIKKASPGFAK